MRPPLRLTFLIPFLLVAAILIAFPQVIKGYAIYLATLVLITALFAVSFNLLFGFTGLLSFGHAAFYAMGAYACGIFLINYTSSPLLAMLVGTFAAALLSVPFGLLCIRHTRVYFLMLTLAASMIVYTIAWKWVPVTGGDTGLLGIPKRPLQLLGYSIPLSQPANYYYFVLVVVAVSIYILYRVVNSPFGLVLKGMRENEERVKFAGVSIIRYRLIAFVISGTFAGLAGSLRAILESTVTPVFAYWTTSAEPVLISILGGAEAFMGPIIGAVLFVVIKNAIAIQTQLWLIWFGIILLILIMALRGGVVGSVQILVNRVRSRRGQ
jgi:branched-chain amino acid transport system permease protein